MQVYQQYFWHISFDFWMYNLPKITALTTQQTSHVQESFVAIVNPPGSIIMPLKRQSTGQFMVETKGSAFRRRMHIWMQTTGFVGTFLEHINNQNKSEDK